MATTVTVTADTDMALHAAVANAVATQKPEGTDVVSVTTEYDGTAWNAAIVFDKRS